MTLPPDRLIPQSRPVHSPPSTPRGRKERSTAPARWHPEWLRPDGFCQRPHSLLLMHLPPPAKLGPSAPLAWTLETLKGAREPFHSWGNGLTGPQKRRPSSEAGWGPPLGQALKECPPGGKVCSRDSGAPKEVCAQESTSIPFLILPSEVGADDSLGRSHHPRGRRERWRL